jgi:hypothetical protein
MEDTPGGRSIAAGNVAHATTTHAPSSEPWSEVDIDFGCATPMLPGA